MAELLGYGAPLVWRREGDGVAIDLPAALAPSPACSLRLSPAPAG